MDEIALVGSSIKYNELTDENKKINDKLTNRAEAARRILDREVNELKQRFPNQDK